jgi:hypothetical protein
MKAHVEWAWAMDAMHVFLYDRAPYSAYYTVGEDSRLVRHEWSEGSPEPMQPALLLPRQALDAIVAAGSEKLPPHDATVDALKDARVTRDRLLALVEHSMTKGGGA